MLRYAIRSPLRLDPNTNLEHSRLVEWANAQLSRENDIIKQIGQQMSTLTADLDSLILELLGWLEHSQSALEDLHEEVEVKTLDI